MALNTGETRMSVFPQLPTPAIVQPMDPLAAFNAARQTVAQVAEQPMRDQMAQVALDLQKRSLLTPVLLPQSETIETQPREVPNIFDQKAYDKAYTYAYQPAYDEEYPKALTEQMQNSPANTQPSEVDIASAKQVATTRAAQRAEAVANQNAYPAQAPVQDQIRVQTFIDAATKQPVTRRTLYKSAEQVASEQATAESRLGGEWERVSIADPNDPTGRTAMWVSRNKVTGEIRSIGGDVAGTSLSAWRQSQIERNNQLNDVSKETSASRKVYADLNNGVVPTNAEIQQWSVQAGKEGVSVPIYLRTMHTANPLLMNAYFKTVMTSGPIAANAQYPAQAQAGTEMMAAIKRDEDALLAARKVPDVAGGSAGATMPAVQVPGLNASAAIPSTAFQSTAVPTRAVPVTAAARTWNAPTVADAQSLVTSGMAKEGDKVVVGNQSFTVKNTAGGR